jgi:tetratricopeptide (TPR) repeat protein
MKYGIATSITLLCLLPGCGLISGSAREDAPPDPVQTYEAFGRSLEPMALDRDALVPAGSARKSDLGRLDAARRKAWLVEEEEAVALAMANGPDDILGTDRTSRLARGLALYKERKLEGARETFLALLKEEPAYFPARRNLGETSLLLEEWEAARDAFRVVHEQLGSGPRTDSNLGLILLLKFPEENKLGRELLARHYADLKHGMRNLQRVVEFDFRAQRPDRAEPLILEASKVHQSPEDTRRLALLLALAQYRQGKFDKSGAHLIRLANQEWSGQGDALAALFQVQRALGLFEDAQKTLAQIRAPRFAGARNESGYSEADMEGLTAQIAEEIKVGHRIVAISIPEIVIDLIYQPSPAKRRETLVQIDRQRNLKNKALFYELCLTRDSDPENRRFAYLLLARAYADNRSFLELGIKDSDTSVRSVAISKLEALPEIEAKDSLFRALERENDPALFKSIHEALCRCSQDSIMLDPGEDSTEAGREKRRLFWAKKLDILRSNTKEGSFIQRGKSKG